MKRLSIVLSVAALLVVATARESNATLVLSIDDPFDASPVLLIGDGSALDSNPVAGAVTFLGPVGSFFINVSTGIGSPPLFGQIDLNTIDVNISGVGTLILGLSQTGFTAPGVPGVALLLGGTTVGTVSVTGFVDTDDGLFITAGPTVVSTPTIGPLGPGAFSAAVSSPGIVPPDFSYSLTILATIVHVTDGTTSFDAELTVVPEPNMMVVFGGLIGICFGFGFVRNRR